mmetsp:Transcript_54183/g.93326  ORF Transcript_54183/g.93326 Transcript_54183/m.93326 type:complete len:378 (-) Transcript_54183:619-1752(-)
MSRDGQKRGRHLRRAAHTCFAALLRFKHRALHRGEVDVRHHDDLKRGLGPLPPSRDFGRQPLPALPRGLSAASRVLKRDGPRLVCFNPLVYGELEVLESLQTAHHDRLACLHRQHAFWRHQASREPFLGEAEVGVVCAHREAVLRPGSEHAVRLVGSLGDQVVDEHPDVALVSFHHKRGPALRAQPCVGPRDDALRRRLLVARGAADLPREEEPAHLLRLQRVFEAPSVHVIVFHVVPGPHDLHCLQPFDGTQDFELHVLGERPAEAVGVHQVRGEALGFQPHHVPAAVRKALHLLEQARAVPRAVALSALPLVRRELVRVSPHHFVRAFVGVGFVALHVPPRARGFAAVELLRVQVRERHVLVLRELGLENIPIDG